jgi:DNA mismatch repair ATPase MutL
LVCQDTQGLLIAELLQLELKAETRRLLALWNHGKWPTEKLSIPRICRLPDKLRLLAEQHGTLLNRWGFESEGFGDGDFSLRSRPSFIPEFILEKVFLAFLEKCESPQEPQLVICWLLDLCRRLSSTELSCPTSLLLEELMKQLNESDHNQSITIHHIRKSNDSNP